MADIIFRNNATSLLAATIGIGDTTIQLGSGDGNALFPVTSPPEYFVAALEDGSGNIEIVQCTERVGDLLTVVRGYDNTTAQAWSMTVTRIELRLTSIVMEEFIQRAGDIMTGELDMDGNDLLDAVLDGPNTQMIAGEIVNVPLRGLAGASGNEITVPTDGTSRAQAGGANIRVEGDDVTGDVASASETVEGIAEIADASEMDAQTDDLRIVTPKKFRDRVAENTIWGTIRTANQTQVDNGSNSNRAITPDVFENSAQLAQATTSDLGRVIKATQGEVDTGTDPDKYVTPETLANTPIGGGNLGDVYHGYVPSNALGEKVPAGWSATRQNIGRYTIVHNLGLADIDDLIIQITCLCEPPFGPVTDNFILGTAHSRTANQFQVTVGLPDMGSLGGADHEDRNWYFTCFDIN